MSAYVAPTYLDKLDFVDVKTSPRSSLEEGRIVFGTQQNPVEQWNFFAKLADYMAEDCALWLNQTSFHSTHVVLDYDRVVVLMRVALNVIGFTKILKFLVRDWLWDLLQKLDDILLFVKEILVSWNERKYFIGIKRTILCYKLHIALHVFDWIRCDEAGQTIQLLKVEVPNVKCYKAN